MLAASAWSGGSRRERLREAIEDAIPVASQTEPEALGRALARQRHARRLEPLDEEVGDLVKEAQCSHVSGLDRRAARQPEGVHLGGHGP